MNWFWGFWFKDKFRTPFSVYKMSFAELIVLGGMIFGVGFGLVKGAQAIAEWSQNLGDANTAVEAVDAVVIEEKEQGV